MELGGSDEGGGGVLCSCNTEKLANVHIVRRSFVRPVHTSYYVGGRLSNGASWGVCFSHLSESLESEWQALSDVGRLAF